MSNASSSSESVPDNLKELLATNAVQAKTIDKLHQENELIKFELEQLKQHVFGKSSEKQPFESPEQERLFDGATPEPDSDAEYIEVCPYKKKRRSKKSIPKDLPVVEEVYEPEQSHCPDCGEELEEYSRDEREELEFEPARFFKRRHITVHCSCPKCRKSSSGRVPSQYKPVIPGACVGAGFLGHMITSRICDHLPYYRQSQIYERDGVYIPDKTLSRYGLKVGALLEPVAKAIKAELLKQEYLQADETHLDVLDSEKSSNMHKGQLWVLNDPLSALVCYEYHEGRNKSAAKALLDDFKGTLQTDGYVCYNEHEGQRMGCMTHARRYFIKAKKYGSKQANHALHLIGKLYRIERELKKKRGKLNDEQWFEKRLRMRQDRSIQILDELKEYLLALRDTWLLEEHPMFKAINYMLNRFDSFVVYTTDGRYEIDNNAAERAIRPIAIGRRNWMFAGSHQGAKMAAVMMTVVNSCKALKINPQRYLADVLPRLADHDTSSITGLTPFDWKLA